MKNMEHEKKHYLWVLLLGIVITILLGAFNLSENARRVKAEAEHILDLYTVRTESLLDSLFHKTDILESVIITSEGSVPEAAFQDLAKSMIQSPGVRAIQYLPDGIVKYCYPVEGNEGAIGDNVLEMPERREDAVLAVNTREIVISGPYHLTQGGWGLIARNPVFLTDEEGGERFWGFTVIVLDLPDVLEPLMLEELQWRGWQYRISAVTESGEISIVETEGYRDDRSVSSVIRVPSHTWEFSVSPNRSAGFRGLIVVCGVGLSITVLCTIIARMLLERTEQLQRYADMDLLTGAANRRKLMQYFEDYCQKERVPTALLYIDVNKFKEVNDTYGHSQGDILLKELADRMRRYISEQGIVARLGGDEFVILIRHCDTVEEGLCQTDCLRKLLEQEVGLASETIKPGVSIGFASYPAEAESLSDLLELADKRMYKQKQNG